MCFQFNYPYNALVVHLECHFSKVHCNDPSGSIKGSEFLDFLCVLLVLLHGVKVKATFCFTHSHIYYVTDIIVCSFVTKYYFQSKFC
jgi:hypothetical protein